MSVDQIDAQSPLPVPAFDVDCPSEAAHDDNASPRAVGGQLPRVVVDDGRPSDTIEALLLSVARGDHEAFVALQSRMSGLVRLNVRRLLRNATQSEAVTQEIFDEVRKEAIHFDPDRDDGKAWLLTHAHQRAMDGLRSTDGTNDSPAARIDRPASVLLTLRGAKTSRRRCRPLWSARRAPLEPTNKEQS